MTAPDQTPTAETAQPPTLEALMASAWLTVCGGGGEPPTGLITHLAGAVGAHLRYEIDRTNAEATTAMRHEANVLRAALDRLRRAVREQLADAVNEEQLDVDLANGMLEHFGLPQLQRMWQVRTGLAFQVEVSACAEEDAFDAAADALRAALEGCGYPIDWDARCDDEATAGDLDPDGR